MGNANSSHGGFSVEGRRKSRSEMDKHRRYSGGAMLSQQHSQARYDEAGPVDITASIAAAAAKAAAANPSHKGHRPRATTEVSRRSNLNAQKQMSVDQSRPNPADLLSSSFGKDPIEMVIDSHLDKGKRKMPTIFKYGGDAKEVYVCGSFNNWKKLPMSKSTKDFVAIVELDEGEHEYKFMVDGQWINDPNSSDLKEVSGGVQNNLIRVQKADFNAYEALDMDSEAVDKLNALKTNSKRYPDVEFNQQIPNSGVDPSSVSRSYGGPPILPPHLLQVILNKDTSLSCEPTLLPEPHHVMINHLYALSIKDGVMVLSSTQRYKKKYVTTLLYKPMGTRRD